MIIDAHVHLDERIDGTVEGAVRELVRQAREAGITRVVALHLDTQPWSLEEVSEAVAPYKEIKAFANVHPESPNAERILENAIQKLGFIGLKLHPRLQEFAVDSAQTVNLVQIAGEIGIPVLLDAFPDGTHLMQGFSPLRYAALARQCPRTNIIWAHMGGHHVIDFMMLAKRLPNVYMDVSYSLLYYRGSSVPMNMVYAMRSMRFERVFYGSDYPDRPLGDSLRSSLEVLRVYGLDDTELQKLLFTNIVRFFGWNDL
jgi:predicted TIM-barrel fold metal-dependent hydrolase